MTLPALIWIKNHKHKVSPHRKALKREAIVFLQYSKRMHIPVVILGTLPFSDIFFF